MTKKKKIVVESLSKYLAELKDVIDSSSNSELAVYRGQKDFSWPLLPGIARQPFTKKAICKHPDSENDKSAERRLIALLRDYGASHFPTWVWQGKAEEVRWKQIIIAQHYRLPTRLLDWTTNPLVALFFATEGNSIKCNKRKCSTCNSNKEHNSAVFIKTGIDTFSSVSLASKNPNPPKYGGPNDPGFLRPPEIDGRITAQSSVFSISSDPHRPIIEDIKILIPSYKRADILKELDGVGINLRTLLPGLEGVATHLAWNVKYWSKDPGVNIKE